MHIGVVWFEEKDQFNGNKAIRSIQQSVMRGGDDIIVLSSYNTPISQQHFLNKNELAVENKAITHHSYYYDVPIEWLGQPFFDEADYLKQTNEKAYNHEYLGEAVGNGGNVFENIKIETITDEQIERFDKIYCGLDFGYYPDPAAFIACYYHSAQRKLYIFDEIKAYKAGNEAFSKLIEKWKKTKITADSAEPKSIGDYKQLGFIIYGAKKGAGSVEYGMKWLASLGEIIIDSKRCPGAAEEFISYEYERTKDGEIISGYPDKNNHFLDACRYAMEDISKQSRYGFV